MPYMESELVLSIKQQVRNVRYRKCGIDIFSLLLQEFISSNVGKINLEAYLLIPCASISKTVNNVQEQQQQNDTAIEKIN